MSLLALFDRMQQCDLPPLISHKSTSIALIVGPPPSFIKLIVL